MNHYGPKDPSADVGISKRKPAYPVSPELLKYLERYDRAHKLPVHYEDLLRYTDFLPVLDSSGQDTLWYAVLYPQYEMQEIHQGLIEIYQNLRSDGNQEARSHLIVDSIDYCTFGNSHPFRIRIKNLHNDIHDYFYVKKADASRIYGLELEYLLSPSRIDFFVDRDTLIEEHVSGIPGDLFLRDWMDENQNPKRIAKEFVKFNERCFLRLLGDQRSYNFVMVLTPDFDEVKYRIRSIDFDQQCYEGRKNVYKPQFFKENRAYVQLVMDNIEESSILQYQKEERSLMAKRMIVARKRFTQLLKAMKKDELSSPEKIETLKKELHAEFKDSKFLACQRMGEIVELLLYLTLKGYGKSITPPEL